MKLIEKLKDHSGICKLIHEYYFGSSKRLSNKKKNTYFYLIPLLIPGTKNKMDRTNLLNQITVDGINNLLKELKLKETK